ncbi:hypothetical protein Q5752_006399 [Cryptotrichosporon argae]
MSDSDSGYASASPSDKAALLKAARQKRAAGTALSADEQSAYDAYARGKLRAARERERTDPGSLTDDDRARLKRYRAKKAASADGAASADAATNADATKGAAASTAPTVDPETRKLWREAYQKHSTDPDSASPVEIRLAQKYRKLKQAEATSAGNGSSRGADASTSAPAAVDKETRARMQAAYKNYRENPDSTTDEERTLARQYRKLKKAGTASAGGGSASGSAASVDPASTRAPDTSTPSSSGGSSLSDEDAALAEQYERLRPRKGREPRSRSESSLAEASNPGAQSGAEDTAAPKSTKKKKAKRDRKQKQAPATVDGSDADDESALSSLGTAPKSTTKRAPRRSPGAAESEPDAPSKTGNSSRRSTRDGDSTRPRSEDGGSRLERHPSRRRTSSRSPELDDSGYDTAPSRSLSPEPAPGPPLDPAKAFPDMPNTYNDTFEPAPTDYPFTLPPPESLALSTPTAYGPPAPYAQTPALYPQPSVYAPTSYATRQPVHDNLWSAYNDAQTSKAIYDHALSSLGDAHGHVARARVEWTAAEDTYRREYDAYLRSTQVVTAAPPYPTGHTVTTHAQSSAVSNVATYALLGAGISALALCPPVGLLLGAFAGAAAGATAPTSTTTTVTTYG